MFNIITFLLVFLLIPTSLLGFDCSSLEKSWETKRYLNKEYGKVSGLNYDQLGAEQISMLKKMNNRIYQDYIRALIFSYDTEQTCPPFDPIIKFINSYSDFTVGDVTFERLIKIIIDDKHNADIIWNIDLIISMDKSLADAWAVKFGMGFLETFINQLKTSIIQNDTDALRYFVILLNHSDGAYGEYMVEKTWDILIANPYRVLLNLDLFEVERLKSILCNWRSQQDRDDIMHTFLRYPPSNNRSLILEWLTCRKDKVEDAVQ